MKVLINHPTSNQNNRAVLKGLLNEGMVYRFITSIAIFPGSFINKLSNINSLKEISRRSFNPELKTLTKTFPIKEIFRLFSGKMGLSTLIKHETGIFSVDAVYYNLDKKVASSLKKASQNGLDAIYAYEDGAYYSFKEAKKHGVECLYDLPIGYWKAARKLLSKEIELWPEWKATLHGFKDSETKLKRKDNELALADRIFVASTFTAKTLKEYPGQLAPIKVIPYGFPKPIKNRVYNIGERPIKLLFVGGLSQRKGIANMFTAVNNLLPHVELTVIGRKSTNDCEALNDALIKYKWIPSLPHDEVLKQMQEHDVLLFPSLFEGFGLVITEAMSQGTPVITTDRTAGPDLIEHDVNGWIVEAGSTDELQKCIRILIEHPEKIVEAGKKAIETAKQRPWSVYGKELANAILKG
ncbi:Glycosyltransferase involved in cell wall bisynthesis [Flaviramulus basaltis]|uniref:Glycosyltransferase involved in cell wall bisynthesis n=1 Tax=Flaviramulus basaltis TaxID=369401 RepID=A0A1K2INK7_9FLAO|nr:glycosyltransferase family 4 protein [Flaviramulus basaltis]SFZ94028.1 Glycosyltransferase involved in cell wall bisynthesis [Flaviramulus basaltis]